MTIGRGSAYFGLLSLVTILAGALLYWRASNGLQAGWIGSTSGIAYTLGALAAIVSLAWASASVGPESSRIGRISAEVAARGGPPTAEQAAMLERLGQQIDLFARADAVLLGVAAIAMAVARYL